MKRVHVVLFGLRIRLLSESMYVFHVGMTGCLFLPCLCRSSVLLVPVVLEC